MRFANNHMDTGKIVFSGGDQLQTHYHSMPFPGSVSDKKTKCNISLKGRWQTLGENLAPLKLVTKCASMLARLRLLELLI